MIVAALALSSLSTFTANAEETESTEFAPHTYYGFHVGSASTELNQGTQDFSYFHLGATYGNQYSENFGFEGVVSITLGDDKDAIVSQGLGFDVGTQFNSFAGYFTAKTSGKFYAKGRLGLAYSTFVYTASGYEDETESALGASYGVGFGVQGESFDFELDYTIMPEVDDPLFNGVSYDSSLVTLSLMYSF